MKTRIILCCAAAALLGFGVQPVAARINVNINIGSVHQHRPRPGSRPVWRPGGGLWGGPSLPGLRPPHRPGVGPGGAVHLGPEPINRGWAYSDRFRRRIPAGWATLVHGGLMYSYVPVLPSGARSVVVGGVNYFVWQGLHCSPFSTGGGRCSWWSRCKASGPR
jgi:hypothetical protein